MAPPSGNFDKKKYRERKYGNKHKIEQWKENKKKKALRDLKRFKNEPIRISDRSKQRSIDKSKPKAIDNVRNVKIEEKRLKAEAAAKAKGEKEAALAEYARKKADKFKKLSKRTKRGQPLMKDRMEMLLEEIQREA